MAKSKKIDKAALADEEYSRLVEKYTEAGADAIRIEINDRLIRKVAELYAILESMKDLPTIIYNPANPTVQRETAAGKARVKYMAQYSSAMQKLNKEMLGALNNDEDDGLGDYE